MKNRRLIINYMLCIFICFGIVPVLNGQEAITWMKTYGWDQISSYQVEQTPDGGYAVLGSIGYYFDSISILGYSDSSIFFLTKFDINGESIWTKTFEKSEPSGINHFNLTIDGGYILAGGYNKGGVDTNTTKQMDIGLLLIKTDEKGDTLWTKTYWGGFNGVYFFISHVEQTSDGGYIFCGGGYTWDATSDELHAFLVKTNSKGDTLWTAMDYDNHFYDVKQTSDLGYIVLGYDPDSLESDNTFLIKYDQNGDTVWTKNNGMEIYKWTLTFDDGFLFADAYDTGVLLRKSDADGKILWTKVIDLSNNCYVRDVEQTNDDGYIILLQLVEFPVEDNSYHIDAGVCLIKTDIDGNVIWTKTFDRDYNGPRDVEQTSDGGYILLGNTTETDTIHGQPTEILSYAWMIKTDANGNVTTSSIDDNINEHGIKMYPNPTTNLLTIETIQPGQHFIEITSLNGQLLYSDRIEGPIHQIDLSSFENGIFLISVRSKNYIRTQKLIKQ